jgi:RNA polymerase sigma factor (sigma-70 family)
MSAGRRWIVLSRCWIGRVFDGAMSTVAASDLELLRQYRAGSEAAFAALVARHVDWVYAAALRRVGNVQLAEDVTQCVFIALARSGRMREGTVMSAWLFQVLRFTSAKAVRTELRRRHHETEAAKQRPAEAPSDDEAHWQELAPILDEAVASLGGRDRQAILLRFYQRSSIADVAGALAISEEGARKRVTRAVAKLRRQLVSQGVELVPAALAASMEAHVTPAAPTGTAAGLGQSVRALRLFDRWRRRVRLALLLKTTGVATAALVTLATASAGVWMALPKEKNPTPEIATTQGNPATADPPAPMVDVVSDQAKFAVAQCKASYERVQDVSYHFHSIWQGDFKQENTGTAKQSDSTGREALDEVVLDHRQEFSTRISGYLTPQSCGNWFHSGSPALEFSYSDPTAMSKEAKVQIFPSRAPHVEKYAFGFGNGFVWEWGDLIAVGPMIVVKSENVTVDGRPLVRVSGFEGITKLNPTPSMVFYFDPAKGYTVARQEGRLMDGTLLETDHDDVEDVTGHGDWFPVKVVETRYDGPNPALAVGTIPKPTYTLETTIDHVVINPPFKDEEFSLAALELDEGTPVAQYNEKDKRTAMIWSGGALHRPQ